MNLRISVTAATAVFLASLSLNAVVQANGWLFAGLGAIIVVAAAGFATRLPTLTSALAATLIVAVGAIPLLSAATWPERAPGLAIVALTAASATGHRLLRGFATAAAYVAALLIYLNLVFATAASFWHLVPTYRSIRALGKLVPLAFDQFKFSPPVPDSRPINLVAAAGIGMIAVIVDIVAVRMRRPALAGIPLLVLFCVPVASNLKTFGVKQALIFGAALSGFLALLSVDGRMRLRMWGRLVTFRYVQSADETGGGPDTRELAASGRRIGLAAVCLAVIVPFMLPGIHAHALFGTTNNGRPTAGGLDAFLAVQHDLTERTEPVLSYKTDASDPSQQYFQVFVLNYSNSTGAWRTEMPNGIGGVSPILGSKLPYRAPAQLVGAPARTVHTSVQVGSDQGGPTSYLPVPYYPVDLSVPGTDWQELAGSQIILSPVVGLSGLRYSVTSQEADPSRTTVNKANQAVPANIQNQYATYSGPDAARLLTIANRHTKGAVTLLQSATDLQNWFQSGAFTYSLRPDLPKSHWLLSFLTTHRRGYCQQFAWAFAVLARLVGIPSRVVIGYTGGSRSANGTWLITTADAHAWPELYFAGQGWLRFEPTPNGNGGQGTATVPGYATGPSTASGAGPATGASQGHGNTGASASKKKNGNLSHLNQLLHDQPGAAGAASRARETGLLLAIGIPLLVVLLLGAPALSRRLTRRRRWLAASGDAGLAQAAWQELTDDLTDLGLPRTPGETPRALVGRVTQRTGFDTAAVAALTRIASAEERARYARHPAPGEGLAADVRAVHRAVAASVARKQRVKAILLPASTLAAARRLLERAGGLLGWLDTSWPTVRRQMRRAAAHRSA